MKAKILITGANGQLGRSLLKLGPKFPNLDLRFRTASECDITDKDQVKKEVVEYNPDYLINAAAYTSVDKAESEPEKALAVNAYALQNIGQAMAGKKCIHLSTDYVYHLEKMVPYTESMDLNPQSVYAQSKAMGESILRRTPCHSLIIRTSWVYSEYGHNFVKTMLNLAESRDEIKVVNDQWGSPTYGGDLARSLLEIVSLDYRKLINPEIWNQIYNYSNRGNISWYVFAKAIMELSDKDVHIVPIPTALFPRPASRPPWGVMDTSKIEKTFNIKIIDWKVSLEKCLAYLIN